MGSYFGCRMADNDGIDDVASDYFAEELPVPEMASEFMVGDLDAVHQALPNLLVLECLGQEHIVATGSESGSPPDLSCSHFGRRASSVHEDDGVELRSHMGSEHDQAEVLGFQLLTRSTGATKQHLPLLGPCTQVKVHMLASLLPYHGKTLRLRANQSPNLPPKPCILEPLQCRKLISSNVDKLTENLNKVSSQISSLAALQQQVYVSTDPVMSIHHVHT